jgi:hypothetical protein
MSFPVYISLVLAGLRFLEKIGHQAPEKKEHAYTNIMHVRLYTRCTLMGGTMKLSNSNDFVFFVWQKMEFANSQINMGRRKKGYL